MRCYNNKKKTRKLAVIFEVIKFSFLIPILWYFLKKSKKIIYIFINMNTSFHHHIIPVLSLIFVAQFPINRLKVLETNVVKGLGTRIVLFG
jgi:hypothetical protein